MRIPYLTLVACLVFPAATVVSCLPQDSDWNVIVTGRVLDSKGRPVSDARIEVFPLEVGVSGPLPSAITDKDGKFRLLSPAFGKTRLCAVKEEAGYPNTQDLVFVSGKDNRPVVNFTSGAKLDGIDILLGEPDGILEGTVIDSETGRPIPDARITLRRMDGVSAFHSTSLPKDGHFLFALPRAPISIVIVRPGYERWQYRNPQTAALGLILDNSAHETMRVELKPAR